MSPLILTAWLAVAGDMPPATPPAEKPDVEIPVRCGATVCILPRQTLADLAEAHNLHVERIRELEKQLETKGCTPAKTLPKLKRERNS